MLGKIKIEDYTPQFILDQQMKDTPDPIKRSEYIKNFHQTLKNQYHSYLNFHHFELEHTTFIMDIGFFGVELEVPIETELPAFKEKFSKIAQSLVTIKESVLGDTSWHI